MITCCDLALRNADLALYIAIGAFVTIALLLLMLFGYNLKLDRRTLKLEKKNDQIDELKKELQKLKDHV